MSDGAPTSQVTFLGRYALHDELASGGMATIHLGRLLGPVGFARTVAIKRLHRNFARDPQFVAMFLDEARLAARIRHQNVVPTIDVVTLEGEIFLVMEYVHGESLSRLMAACAKRGERVPLGVTAATVLGVLSGLHAAHEAKSERGAPLGIVHRDVSPQNVLVGVDGLARVVDFGIAKAAGRLQTTEDGRIKGKMAYMAPEQLLGERADRRADIWAASVVLWEMLAGRRLFESDSAGALANTILHVPIEPPSRVSEVPASLDAVVMRGLEAEPAARFQSAREMALALEAVCSPASSRAVGDWVEEIAAEVLRSRALRVEQIESAGGGERSTDGSVGKQLARLGFEAAPRGPRSSRPPPPSPELAEAPTLDAPGRTRASDAPPLTPAVSEAPPAEPPAPRTTPREVPWRAPLAILALGLVGMALGMLGRAPGVDPHATSATSSASSTAPSTSSPATPPTVSAASSSPDPGAEVRADTRTPPHRSAPVTPPMGATGRAAAPDASIPRDRRCDPPYTVGPAPDFIRTPKLECLPP
jgi:serine/threonine-protein kinase